MKYIHLTFHKVYDKKTKKTKINILQVKCLAHYPKFSNLFEKLVQSLLLTENSSLSCYLKYENNLALLQEPYYMLTLLN